jgi:hypothetical protein
VTAEIRHGRYQDVLADVECDTVIVDPPYGQRTHEWSRIVNNRQADDCEREPIDYAHWTSYDVSAFVSRWASSRCWIVAMTSHDLVPLWMEAFDKNDLYSFPPLGILISGMGVRMGADGPASWTLHLMVARRKRKMQGSKVWRSLPGGYTGPATPGMAGGRGKPAWLIEALVRDYSDPGMTVCDPCAGWGSTLIAARKLGRNAIGAEMDREAYEIAERTLRGEEARPRVEQPSLFGGAA